MLGGADIQVHAIERAVDMGLHVITCDNRPDNPGHRHAHRSHDVSTTDLDGVLQLARDEHIDAILAYASDPAALTAAYVADRLGLPGDPLHAVRRAQHKLLLRTTQRDAGLPTPDFADGTDTDAVTRLAARHPDGIIIKPVDSSGSRGITTVRPATDPHARTTALTHARTTSPTGHTIAEALWGTGHHQPGGNVVVVDGTVRYACLADEVLAQGDDANIDLGSLTPSTADRVLLDGIVRQVQALVTALGLRQGVYNFQARVDDAGEVAVVDFGARIGGNLSALSALLSDGVDLVETTILTALGRPLPDIQVHPRWPHVGRLVLHSTRPGTLVDIHLHPDIERMAQHILLSARPGDTVRPFRTSADRLGVIVLASDDRHALEQVYAHPETYIDVELEQAPA